MSTGRNNSDIYSQTGKEPYIGTWIANAIYDCVILANKSTGVQDLRFLPQMSPEFIYLMATALQWHLHICIATGKTGNGFSNGCGPLLRVQVWVITEPSENQPSRSSIHVNCQFGYRSIAISHPVWIGEVVGRLSSGSIYRLIKCSCFCCLIIVSYQNCSFNIQ